ATSSTVVSTANTRGSLRRLFETVGMVSEHSFPLLRVDKRLCGAPQHVHQECANTIFRLLDDNTEYTQNLEP
ncbi:17114_t:CDS:2, partial [Dentiscutata heterogama]